MTPTAKKMNEIKHPPIRKKTNNKEKYVNVGRGPNVKARVRGGLAMCILAFSGCGSGAPRIFFWGYDSVEPILCHYADVSRLGT